MTSLGDMLAITKKIASTVRNGSYDARRGAINWSNFPFTKKPRAIAIMCDETALLPQSDNQIPAVITLEMFEKRADYQEDEGIEDLSMDRMREDARKIIEELITTKNADRDSVVLVLDVAGIKAIETHDVAKGVQGLIVTFSVRV